MEEASGSSDRSWLAAVRSMAAYDPGPCPGPCPGPAHSSQAWSNARPLGAGHSPSDTELAVTVSVADSGQGARRLRSVQPQRDNKDAMGFNSLWNDSQSIAPGEELSVERAGGVTEAKTQGRQGRSQVRELSVNERLQLAKQRACASAYASAAAPSTGAKQAKSSAQAAGRRPLSPEKPAAARRPMSPDTLRKLSVLPEEDLARRKLRLRTIWRAAAVAEAAHATDGLGSSADSDPACQTVSSSSGTSGQPSPQGQAQSAAGDERDTASGNDDHLLDELLALPETA
jgi:hypothetical protein